MERFRSVVEVFDHAQAAQVAPDSAVFEDMSAVQADEPPTLPTSMSPVRAAMYMAPVSAFARREHIIRVRHKSFAERAERLNRSVACSSAVILAAHHYAFTWHNQSTRQTKRSH
jgi:hypothetical protein